MAIQPAWPAHVRVVAAMVPCRTTASRTGCPVTLVAGRAADDLDGKSRPYQSHPSQSKDSIDMNAEPAARRVDDQRIDGSPDQRFEPVKAR